MEWGGPSDPSKPKRNVPRVSNPTMLLNIAHGNCVYHKPTRAVKTFRVPSKMVIVFLQPDVYGDEPTRPEMFGNDTAYMDYKAQTGGSKGKRAKATANASENVFDRLTDIIQSTSFATDALKQRHQMASAASVFWEFRYKTFFPGQYVPDVGFTYGDPGMERLGLYHFQKNDRTFRSIHRLSDEQTLHQVTQEVRLASGSQPWIVLFTMSCLSFEPFEDARIAFQPSTHIKVALDKNSAVRSVVDESETRSISRKRKRESRYRWVKSKERTSKENESDMSWNGKERVSSRNSTNETVSVDSDRGRKRRKK